MSTPNQVASLLQTVQRMTHAMSLSAAYDGPEASQRRLVRLGERLQQLLLISLARLDPDLELEFYAVIESHPNLRQLYELVVQEDIVAICRDGLKYYAALQQKRPLTSREWELLSQGEDVCREEAKKLEQLREQLR